MNVLCAALFATVVLSPEQTLDRRAIGELAFSPDGTRVVFTVTEPVQGVSRARSIWLLDVATGRARQLTFSGKSDSSPRWSPDGRGIAFISDRDGAAQLYLLPIASAGEAEKLTDRKEAVSEFRWSPDGSRIALLMAEPKPPEQESRERTKNDSRRADKDERHARVWILDVTTRTLAQLTASPHRFTQVEWMPTGKALVGIGDATPGSDRWTEQIYTIDAATGTIVAGVAPRGPFGGLTVGMDGNTIAYVGARVDGPEPHDLYAVRLPRDTTTRPTTTDIGSGVSQTNLTATAIDRPVGQPRWIDARTIAAIVARGFKSTIALVTLEGHVTDLETPVNPTSFAHAPDGTFVFAGETTTQPPELWIKRVGAPATKATTLNEKWASMPVVSPEFIKYKSFDGKEVEAALLRPSSPQPQGPSAFVVLVHGGPTGRWSDAFEPWGQLLAQSGYAVMYPNIRGSVGYGETFVEANRADWGGGDFKDVMAAVDWAVAQRIADPARLGIGGWSYGGFMAAWAVTQTTRFKAAVSGAPVIDMASEFGTERGSAYDEWFYGTPYERLDGFIKSSPMTYVKNVRTPTLLLQGEADETDPIGQSQQFYRGLKRYGVETDLVLYPREGHGLREEPHLLDRLNRVLSWYDRHLKAAAAPTSPAS